MGNGGPWVSALGKILLEGQGNGELRVSRCLFSNPRRQPNPKLRNSSPDRYYRQPSVG